MNYNETAFSFDGMGRQNKTVTPGGTITRTVHDSRNLALSVYVGTDDNGATDGDPTGGGGPGNNMVALQINVYDGGAGGGDGNLTRQSVPFDANSSNDRVTVFQYDWRNRQTRITAAQDWYQANTLDTLDSITQVQRYSQATNNLISQSATLYDNRGRVYRTIRYAVDPSTGSVGTSLVDNNWFDPAGNLIKGLPSGSNAFTKHVFDNLGRETTRYVGYDLSSGESNHSSASDVSDDTIMEQLETAYDEADNVIQTTTRQRFHDAIGAGALTYPGGLQPIARVTYLALYPDALGREQAEANYGTNGDASFTRPATIPTSSVTVLVALARYNSRGEAHQTVDQAGRLDQMTFDDAGRRTQVVLNVRGSSSNSSNSSSNGLPTSHDKNNTTLWTYTADSLIATLVAVNSATGDQVTTYTYGTSLSTSDIARNDNCLLFIFRRALNPSNGRPPSLGAHDFTIRGALAQLQLCAVNQVKPGIDPFFAHAWWAINRGFADAVTHGPRVFFKNYPYQDTITDLPLIGHEATHSLHAFAGLGTALFDVAYVGDFLGQLPGGSPYQGNLSEIAGHTMQHVITSALARHPALCDDVCNGTARTKYPAIHNEIRNLYVSEFNRRTMKYRLKYWPPKWLAF